MGIILGIVMSASVHAAPPALWEMMMRSATVQQISKQMDANKYVNLVKFEETKVLRCPSCFEFELTFERPRADGVDVQKKTIQTSYDPAVRRLRVEEK